MKRVRKRHVAAIVVFAVTLLVFLPSVTGTFVYDDVPLIEKNEYVQSWHWAARAFHTHFWDVTLYSEAREMRGSADFRQYYRPLVTLSYLANWMFGDGKAWSFHLVNTLLHALTAALATRAATRWTASLRLGLVSGLVFAIHPSRTENVTWISGRTDVMMMLFVFLALEAFRAFERAKGRWRAIDFALGLLALGAAVLCKEPAAMFPLLALADRETHVPARRSWLVPAVTGVLCVTYGVGRALFWAPEGGITRHFTPAHFLMTVGAYVGRVLFPWPPTMFHHALESDAAGQPIYSRPLMALGAASLAAAIVVAWLSWKRARTAFWLLVSAFAFMGPLLNVYFTGLNVSAQDRFLYAPLFFAFVALVTLSRAPAARIAKRRVGALALAGVALAAVFVVEIRTLDYRSNQSFWLAEYAENPDHPYALENLGTDAAARGDLAAAYAYFTRAERPEALKYRLAGGEARRVKAHFLRAVMLAGMLPDGRGDDLARLAGELWRLFDPAYVPAPAVVDGYEIGRPFPMTDEHRVAVQKALQWDVALLATRTGDFPRADVVVSRASRELLYVLSNPLNGALALARMGRLDEADAVASTLAWRAEHHEPSVPESDLAGLRRTLAAARAQAAARDRAKTPSERATLDAVRLAGLGAYLAALRSLDDASLLESDETAPLVAQLLVACRLEDAARAHAARHLGKERAAALVSELAAELPPSLRAIDPVPGSLAPILERVRRETR